MASYSLYLFLPNTPCSQHSEQGSSRMQMGQGTSFSCFHHCEPAWPTSAHRTTEQFCRFLSLQTGLKKKSLREANWKSEGKNPLIQCVQNNLFLFQLPNHRFTHISNWKALLRSKIFLSICVRTKIKSTTAWKLKWNAAQSVWLVTHQRAGNQRLKSFFSNAEKGRQDKFVEHQNFSCTTKSNYYLAHSCE